MLFKRRTCDSFFAAASESSEGPFGILLVCVSLPCSVLIPLLLEGDLFSKGDDGAGGVCNGGGAVASSADCGGGGRSSIALACLGRTALTPEVD